VKKYSRGFFFNWILASGAGIPPEFPSTCKISIGLRGMRVYNFLNEIFGFESKGLAKNVPQADPHGYYSAGFYKWKGIPGSNFY
jgi:hypothetical protein